VEWLVPVGRRLQVATRLLTAGAVSLAVLLVAYLLFVSGSSYTVHATLINASQLVRGDQVKVGGVPVGSVSDLELGHDAQARITLTIDDGSLTPLHRGSRMEVRSVGLASIAGRYVSLTPGPNNAPKIADGGTIPADDTQSEVDLDTVLNTLDQRTLGDLSSAVRGLGTAFSDPAGREFNAGVHVLNPALSQAAATAHEVVRDQGTFERFLLESADVVSAVASRNSQLERLVPAAGGTLSAIAARTSSLDEILRGLPPTLREANTTLVNLRGTIGDLRPAIREARPVAPPLNEFLTRLRPVAREGVVVIPALRSLIDRRGAQDLLGVLRTMPSVARRTVPAFNSAVQTTKDALPIVRALRPYTTDFVGGQLGGYGGAQSLYYDANGRFIRISFQGSGYTLNNQGTLIPQPPSQPGLTGYRTGLASRCPGAATQSAPDRSNPWDRPAANFLCRPEQDPR
jgi:phospholipid/cholesterol/gamma-HCH transport system substrate-binding protein